MVYYIVRADVYIGNVFRRDNTGITSQSNSGDGTSAIGWQGYEVITGRITSQNLGNWTNFCYAKYNVCCFRFYCVCTKVQQIQRKG